MRSDRTLQTGSTAPGQLTRRGLTAVGALLLLAGPARAAAAQAVATDYRALDDKQLGHLDFIAGIAGRPGGDWSEMGHSEPGQGGFDSYRYQLAMMAYTLYLANHHYTPAYRDLHQATSQQLIDKMLRFDVWAFWEETSRGAKMFDPDLKELTAGWIDPVKEQNIMYSGHLFQMVTTHAMLFNDGRYEQPGAIKFLYNPVGRGLGPQTFVYDTASLSDVLYKQFERSEWRGIECEPNAIFPECNQHPILGFAAQEVRKPTGYFRTVSTHFKQKFDAMKYIDPKTQSFMGMYLKRQDRMVYNALPWSDGWSGTFMHAWSKADVEQVYPIQKANFLVPAEGGTTVKGASYTYSHDHGFFAALAAEVGDQATRDAMLAYADRYWSPKWDENGLRYPRQDQTKQPGDAANVFRRVQVLTGNSLIGMARMNVKDGFLDMYNRPRRAAAFSEPFISDVNYPDTKVSRAIYDPKKEALVVTLRSATSLVGPQAPRRVSSGSAAWSVNKLEAARAYGVWRDGRKIAEIRNGAVTPLADTKDSFTLEPSGRIRVTSPLDNQATFIVARE